MAKASNKTAKSASSRAKAAKAVSHAEKLLKKVNDCTAVVGVIGLGYVGLPLVREFCRAGFKVIGFDVDPQKVSMLKAHKSYIHHLPPDLFKTPITTGQFVPTTDMSKLREPDAIIICVPTPLDKMREPDMTYVRGTAETISKSLRPGQIVILESTTYPGTTREVVKPLLDRTKLKVERDYFLAFSPEREDPGRKDYSTHTIPKVCGGFGPRSKEIAVALYRKVVTQVVPVSSCEVAEAAKIVENVYRCINIALVNELKITFDRMGVDVWEVIDAAKTKPFGFQAFYPGPGLGGHCIPIDPYYLSWKAREYGVTTRFIELAGEINTAMPEYVINRVAEALNQHGKPLKGSNILVLGLAYKKDVDDVRESPSVTLIELLQQRGAKVAYHDPFIPRAKPMREHNITHLRSVPLNAATIRDFDCVLISTDHSNIDYKLVAKHAKLVVDTRNACGKVRGLPKGRVVKA